MKIEEITDVRPKITEAVRPESNWESGSRNQVKQGLLIPNSKLLIPV
jgi:hypothetical protein